MTHIGILIFFTHCIYLIYIQFHFHGGTCSCALIVISWTCIILIIKIIRTWNRINVYTTLSLQAVVFYRYFDRLLFYNSIVLFLERTSMLSWMNFGQKTTQFFCVYVVYCHIQGIEGLFLECLKRILVLIFCLPGERQFIEACFHWVCNMRLHRFFICSPYFNNSYDNTMKLLQA